MKKRFRKWSISTAAILGAATVIVSVGSVSISAAAVHRAFTNHASGCKPPQVGRSGKIIDISGPPNEPFFQGYKEGADRAAKQLGISYTYSAPPNLDNISGDYPPLITAAIAEHPAALVIGNFIPTAFDPAIKQATCDGIPVVITSVGQGDWQADGAIAMVGESSTLTGGAAAQAEIKAGAKSGLCVNQEPGAGTLQQRCVGYLNAFKRAGKPVTEMYIPLADNTNDQVMIEDMTGELKSHPSIDAMYVQDSQITPDAVTAEHEVGRHIIIGSAGLSNATLQEVKQGSVLCITDIEIWLQGYYGVLIAEQYVKYGFVPSAQVVTGPQLITKSNVASVLSVMGRYQNIRGS